MFKLKRKFNKEENLIKKKICIVSINGENLVRILIRVDDCECFRAGATFNAVHRYYVRATEMNREQLSFCRTCHFVR